MLQVYPVELSGWRRCCPARVGDNTCGATGYCITVGGSVVVVGVGEFAATDGGVGEFVPYVGDVAHDDGEEEGYPCHYLEGEVGGGAVGDGQGAVGVCQ